MVPVSALLRQGSISFLFGLGVGTLVLDTALHQQFLIMVLGCTGALCVALGLFSHKRFFIFAGLAIIGCWYIVFRSSLLIVPFSNISRAEGVIYFVEPLLSKQRLIVTLSKPSVLAGRNIFVYAERFPDHFVGERVQLGCMLEQPEPIEDFAFDKYAERRGIVGVCRYPKLSVIGHEHSLAAALDRLRKVYSDSFTKNMPAAEDTLLQAMVLNKTGEFPSNLLASFASSGLSHSISISGLHMALLIAAVELLMGASGLSRRVRLTALIVGLGIYLILLGFPSPAVRSCIMGVAMIFGKYSGRQTDGVHILLLTATVMLLQNPLLMGFDIGFQLSCLALLGMGLTNAHWQQLLFFLPERFGIRDVFAATCSAQFFTWPLTIYYFGTFSFIAPIANAFVLPLLPLMLSFAFVTPLLSCMPFIYPAALVLLFSVTKLMNSLVVFFGAIPFASVKQMQISSSQALFALGCMAMVTYLWHRFDNYRTHE